MKEILEKRFGLKLNELPEGAKHEVGKTYFCGYWQKAYTVLEIRENVPVWGNVYVCRWQDGQVNSHSTELKPDYDFEVIQDDELLPAGHWCPKCNNNKIENAYCFFVDGYIKCKICGTKY